jgi:hypothetical protein
MSTEITTIAAIPFRADHPWSRGEDRLLQARFLDGLDVFALAAQHLREQIQIVARLRGLGLLENDATPARWFEPDAGRFVHMTYELSVRERRLLVDLLNEIEAPYATEVLHQLVRLSDSDSDEPPARYRHWRAYAQGFFGSVSVDAIELFTGERPVRTARDRHHWHVLRDHLPPVDLPESLARANFLGHRDRSYGVVPADECLAALGLHRSTLPG